LFGHWQNPNNLYLQGARDSAITKVHTRRRSVLQLLNQSQLRSSECTSISVLLSNGRGGAWWDWTDPAAVCVLRSSVNHSNSDSQHDEHCILIIFYFFVQRVGFFHSNFISSIVHTQYNCDRVKPRPATMTGSIRYPLRLPRLCYG